jgi:hypothetical protein
MRNPCGHFENPGHEKPKLPNVNAHLDMVNADYSALLFSLNWNHFPFRKPPEREFSGGFRLLLNAE